MKDDYLYRRLKEYILAADPDNKVFYSEVYMREKANEAGMQMHDFRRGFALESRNQYMEDGMTAEEANQAVKAALRHARFSTTKRYLYGRKLQLSKRK